MNLSRVQDRTVDEVRILVEGEVRTITSLSVKEGLKTFLIDPRQEMRTWGWNKIPADFPVWVIAESSKFDYGIAFSDYGFAPEHSWGLVFLSHSGFDADYCWYPTLEAAYKDSRLLEEYDEGSPTASSRQ